ncbi:MAG: hemolysin III family protein, partial [Clostridiales bacterium]|nr:hemolysin III family protein [Clostridiales bacterium]
GVLYTVGAVIYGLGKKIKYMHSVWHLFVLGGSVFHYFVIYNIAV